MPIPESQLVTWSHQGSVVQSANTYGSIKAILADRSAIYASQGCDIFLQGSYGNDTNIYSDSDVDIVIATTSIYYPDLSRLNANELSAYNAARSGAGYTYGEFRKQVISQLKLKLAPSVQPGNKAIFIEKSGARRDADVVPVALHRRYYSYSSYNPNDYTEGVFFRCTDGTEIVDFPKQHSANCTQKHQATNSWFKPTVRILKNMRNSMISRGRLTDDVAPSYFLEGMLYNVPNEIFGGSYADTVINALNWIYKSDRTKLVCANEMYFLLHPTSPVTWREEKLNLFLAAVASYWTTWPY